jgi:hypothetical protein
MIGSVSSLFLYMSERATTIQANNACILLSDSIYTSGFLGGLYRFVRYLPTFFKVLYTRKYLGI